MLNRIRKILAVLAIILLGVVSVGGEQLERDILQYKLGRLYFGAGLEENVFAGCPFILFHGQDTVYSGIIESSYPGVSISRPTFGFTDTLALEEHRAVILSAVTDTISSIRVGCYGLHPFELIRTPPTLDTGDSIQVGVPIDTTANSNQIIMSIDEPFNLAWDFEAGRRDGFFAVSMFPESMRGQAEMVSSEAPFIAVMIPNPASEANDQGFLTTSLYYRFSAEHLWPTFFQSEVPAVANRLYLAEGAAPRSYPYDVEKGRQLLARNKSRPSSVKIGYLSPRLENVTKYFADILSRDRVRVEVRTDLSQADIIMTFVPVDWDNPTVSLTHVFRLLSREEPVSKATRESLAIVGNYIESARQAEDVATCFHYCRLADRTMQHELGVFPLFRPTIYFLAGKYIKNVRFDRSGYLDLKVLTRVALPVPPWEQEP